MKKLLNNRIFRTVLIVLVIAGIGYLGHIGYVVFLKEKPADTSNVQLEWEGNGEDITITVWAWNIVADSLNSVIPEFNKEYPNVRVVVEKMPVNDVEDKMNLAILSDGEMPDVIAAEGTISPSYIEKGALLDITSQANNYYDDFVEYKWPEVSSGGRIYGMPWDAGPVGVFYRRDIFEEEGIDPASIETWDDYIEVGRKITKDLDGDGVIDRYMITLSSRGDAVDFFEMLLQQQGGSFFNKNNKVTINSPASERALKLMKEMRDEGIVANIPYFSAEFYDEMKRDKIATYVQAVWLGGLIKSVAPETSGKWGVFPMPAFSEGGTRSSSNGGSNFAITAKSDNPAAAWKFIEFVTTRNKSQLTMYKKHNTFPALKSTYADVLFDEPEKFYGGQVTRRLFVETQEDLPSNWYYSPYYKETTRHVLDPEIASFLKGEKTAKQVLKDSTKRVKEIIAGGE